MNDLKILHNGVNKILLSANGKIIKQSYSFGNALIQTPSSPKRFKIDLSGLTEATILEFYTPLGASNEEALGRIYNTSGLYHGTAVFGTGITTGSLYGTTTLGTGGYYLGATTAAQKINGIVATYINTVTMQLKAYNGYSSGYSDVKAFTSPSPLSYYESFYGRAQYGSGILVPQILIFNRELSLGEIKYIYKNKNYSHPQSIVGLVSAVYFEKGENLDFSTAQDGSLMKVGCRDFSGGVRHAELLSLPAGTTAEKIAYVDSSLLTPYTV